MPRTRGAARRRGGERDAFGVRTLEELVDHLHHRHEMTRDEALAHAQKLIAQARSDEESLAKWRAGRNDNPASMSPGTDVLASCAVC